METPTPGDQFRAEFSWMTEQLWKLSAASNAPTTRGLAKVLTKKLESMVKVAWPELAAGIQDEISALKIDAKKNKADLMANVGPGLWARLHKRAIAREGKFASNTDRMRETMWLNAFANDLPCGDCRKFYTDYMLKNPPAFDDYFRWTWKLHQAVNAKPELAKKGLSYEEALAYWAAAI